MSIVELCLGLTRKLVDNERKQNDIWSHIQGNSRTNPFVAHSRQQLLELQTEERDYRRRLMDLRKEGEVVAATSSAASTNNTPTPTSASSSSASSSANDVGADHVSGGRSSPNGVFAMISADVSRTFHSFDLSLSFDAVAARVLVGPWMP